MARWINDGLHEAAQGIRSFLLVGQSNMAGRGDLTPENTITAPDCFMLRMGRWQPMSEPINVDRAVAEGAVPRSGANLAASFAALLQKETGAKIGLIPCADGGTRISQWQPGEVLFDHAVFQAKLAMRTSALTAILWHQGESDRKVGEKYYKNLKDVISYIRQYLVKKTGNEKYATLPVIIGGIVHSGKGWSNQVGLAQIRLANEDKNIHLVDVHDATLRSDNMHFDAAGAELLGRKVYNELVNLNLAGENAKPVTYKEHSRIVKVGTGGAFMYADFPDNVSGPTRAVVALPGGGYDHLAISHEGTLWSKFFNEHNIAYFTLVYRLPDGNPSIPVEDAEAAIKMLRDSAKVWNIDPDGIGIMGSSAGGHLATTIATHAEKRVRPDFQILFYPVVTFVGKTHGGTRKHFLGKDADNATLCNEYSNELHVKKGVTPPAVIIFAKNDKAVPPASNGIAYYDALRKADIPAKLIEYPEGGHGFGFKASFKFHEQLLSDLGSWLDSNNKH